MTRISECISREIIQLATSPSTADAAAAAPKCCSSVSDAALLGHPPALCFAAGCWLVAVPGCRREAVRHFCSSVCFWQLWGLAYRLLCHVRYLPETCDVVVILGWSDKPVSVSSPPGIAPGGHDRVDSDLDSTGEPTLADGPQRVNVSCDCRPFHVRVSPLTGLFSAREMVQYHAKQNERKGER